MTRLLVVDDAPDMLRLLAHVLAGEGYEVTTARTGKEALEAAAAQPPDVILMDVMMPEMDGLEACRCFKAQPQFGAVPIILLTARSRDEDVVSGLDAGADDYVVKPFRREVLCARVRSAARVKRSHDEATALNQRLRAEIAQRQRMEMELARAQRLESLGRLAAGLAHEINTPVQYLADNLRFIEETFSGLGRVFALLERLPAPPKAPADCTRALRELAEAARQAEVGYAGEEIPRAAQACLDGVGRVAEVVRALAVFSAARGKRKAPSDLGQIVDCALAMCRSQWEDVADVVRDFDPELPPLTCLAGELSEAILNLIVNAAQAIRDAVRQGTIRRGTIAIRARRKPPWAEIRVEDNGTGMAPEICGKVFEPFFTTRDVGEGMGQGLTVAHAIVVHQHAGAITFDTQPGQGTTFIVHLPLDTPETCPCPAPSC